MFSCSYQCTFTVDKSCVLRLAGSSCVTVAVIILSYYFLLLFYSFLLFFLLQATYYLDTCKYSVPMPSSRGWRFRNPIERSPSKRSYLQLVIWPWPSYTYGSDHIFYPLATPQLVMLSIHITLRVVSTWIQMSDWPAMSCCSILTLIVTKCTRSHGDQTIDTPTEKGWELTATATLCLSLPLHPHSPSHCLYTPFIYLSFPLVLYPSPLYPLLVLSHSSSHSP